MKVILVDKLVRVTKNRVKLEKTLGVKINNRGKEVSISGKAEDEYIAEKVIDSLNFGFPYSAAISIKTEDALFEVINIKDHTNRNDLERIRARIIGKGGKTLQALSKLTRCSLEIKDNEVGIIGPAENIENAQTAIISIVKGSKQGNVYGSLERNQPKPITDLGLREKKKKL